MQTPTINWLTLWFALGSAIVTGFFTALTSWLLYRSQLKTKISEIRGQGDIRARELLFESYQRRIDRIGEDIKQFAGALYGFAGHLQALTDENEKREAQKAILVLIRMVRDPLLDSLGELEEELSSVNLAEKRHSDVQFIREALSANLDGPNVDTGFVYLNFMKAFALFNGVKQELLNKKCEALFKPYLEPNH